MTAQNRDLGAIARLFRISGGDDTTVRAGEGALLLLFPRGQRLGVATLRDTVAGAQGIAVTSNLGEGDSALPQGIELLRDGMTYDLVGAAPGPGIALPLLDYRLGVPREMVGSEHEALALQPGPHLAPGARSMPVVRTMMGVAAMIVAHLPGLRAVAWPAAGTVIGPDFFVSSMTAWLAGGAFPALGLTSFAPVADGGLRSEGLAFFTGQELQLATELAEDRAAGTRLGVRLVNQLVGQGQVTAAEAIIGPAGERLTLEPSLDARTVRVRRG